MSYQFTQLKNGLKIVTVPMKDRNSAAVAIWVKTGARYETPKVSGVSHLLEHMLFKGTRKRSTRQIKEEIEGVGGMLNAFTSEEATCYFAKLLAPHFPKALEVLADMINHAIIAPDELKKERTVILEEIKMYRDLPSHHVHDLMNGLLWPDQPMGRSIAGTEKTVSEFTRDEILDYKKKYYQPDRVIVTVSGAVKHSEVVKLSKNFFKHTGKGTSEPFESARVEESGPKCLIVEKKSEQTHLVIAFHGLARFSPDRFKLSLMSMILGGNMSSRLFEEVREKRGLAYEVRAGVSLYQDTGAVSISAGVEAAKSPQAIRVILDELVKMRKKPVTAGELRRAKDYLLSQLCMALEDTLDHLLWAGERIVDGDTLPDQKKIKNYVEEVTAKDIQRMAAGIFRNEDMHLALIGPVDAALQKRIKKEFILKGI